MGKSDNGLPKLVDHHVGFRCYTRAPSGVVGLEYALTAFPTIF